MGRFLKRALALAFLVVIALGGTVILCEVTVRVIDGQPIVSFSLPPLRPTPLPAPKALASTVSAASLPDDVNPAWIDAAPPALARGADIPDLAVRTIAARRVGITSLQLFYVWNSRAVEQLSCTPGSAFARWPEPLRVFDPPEPIAAPMYRYLPSQTLPTGLITNRFGWRGPDIPLDKPPGTVRLAFVGASTTVGMHNLHFSYPEYVIHWLNLWAEHAAPGVRFDGINAGREGIDSSGIAAVVRQEVIPAEPDLVLYYEGANQSLCTRPAPGSPPRRPRRTPFWSSVHGSIRSLQGRWQLADRLKVAALVLEADHGAEPPKPPLDLATRRTRRL